MRIARVIRFTSHDPLHRRQVKGSFVAAIEMVQLLRNVVSTSRWSTAKELMELVRRVGRRVQAAQPGGVC